MLRWLDPRKASEPPDHLHNHHQYPDGVRLTTSSSTTIPSIVHHPNNGRVTDDPLAILESGIVEKNHHQQIYSVSRSVLLPRVVLKTNSTVNSALGANNNCGLGGGINPIFEDNNNNSARKLHKKCSSTRPRSSSKSSGYGGSYVSEHFYFEQNPNYVKSIKVPKSSKNSKSVPSSSSGGSSGGGTLTTIPEGRVDCPIPKPIWPLMDDKLLNQYDSLVDDALLFYTSLNYNPERSKCLENYIDLSVKDLLLELLNSINASLIDDGKSPGRPSPEETLKIVNDKIRLKLELIKNSTEEEMRKLCVNLSNCRKMNSVLKAFSNHSSSSGNSSHQSCWNGNNRVRTFSSENEDLYHIIPSAASSSSSSGFSGGDSLKESPSSTTNNSNLNILPVFVHDDIVTVPNGLRNAMIYGTLYRAKTDHNKLLLEKISKQSTTTTNNNSAAPSQKKSLIRAVNDNKPSVWQQYYGIKAVDEAIEGNFKYVTKPTDVPLFPGGRPEADFTLDVPRSELLTKKMRQDKKWRCRCRLLTSFLGLVFFLLSVMAVSLILTRGKRMFGSMV